MNIIKPKVEILNKINGVDILKHIEKCGRVCYKSEGNITDESYISFIKNLISRGHEAVLEHYSISVKFTCDRGISHEIVRHRMASYCQESTRYCNYSKDSFQTQITVIEPLYFNENSIGYLSWKTACEECEKRYFDLLNIGHTPQEARAVLPNSLKTEIIMTANLREWRYFLKLRCWTTSHPQMREIAGMLLNKFRKEIPIIFDDVMKF